MLEKSTIDKLNKEALVLLDAGDEIGARAKIGEILNADPSNAIATKLLAQITGDPLKVLGVQHFTYKVHRSDTLAKLADEYLGDKLRFYILARYNDIMVPNRLAAGQTIKIPGKRRKPKPLDDAPLPTPAVTQPTPATSAPPRRRAGTRA